MLAGSEGQAVPGTGQAAGGGASRLAEVPSAPAPARVHELGNRSLPPEVAARLIAQAAAATQIGQLQGVSPSAHFLGANPDNTRIKLPSLCQRFVSRDWQPSDDKHAAVYAFRDEDGVPLAAPPADRAGGWKGSFPGKPAWTDGYLQKHGFIKAQTTFKRKDGRCKARGGLTTGRVFSHGMTAR